MLKRILSWFNRNPTNHYSWDLAKTTKEDEMLADFLMQNNFGPREYDYSKWKRDDEVGKHSWMRYAKWMRSVHWPEIGEQVQYKTHIHKWPQINEKTP